MLRQTPQSPKQDAFSPETLPPNFFPRRVPRLLAQQKSPSPECSGKPTPPSQGVGVQSCLRPVLTGGVSREIGSQRHHNMEN